MALTHSRKHSSISPKFDLIQLSSYLQTLASSLYNYFKQTVFHQQTPNRQISIQLELTTNENCALEVNSTFSVFFFCKFISNRFYKVIQQFHRYKHRQV